MIRDDICYLISDSPQPRGIYDAKEQTERMVYCRLRSVSSADYWRARSVGLAPEAVFILSDFREYKGEKLIRYGEGEDAKLYEVMRTYVNGAEIEITVQSAREYNDTTEDPDDAERTENGTAGDGL